MHIPYSENVWQGYCLANSQIQSSWQKRFGKWIDFDHIIYKLKFGWLKFGEAQTIHQIHQTFLLPNIPAIRYY